MRDELSILIWMANPADTGVAARLLAQSGLAFRLCDDLDGLVAEARYGGGALLLEEEALSAKALVSLNAYLDHQPPWSDLPVVLLVRKFKGYAGPGKSWPRLIRNLTLVERPVSSVSLVSMLQAALQSRRRQYEVRDLLANLRDLNENLELRVAERTSELERLATELQQSNKELEQFAYIASHDLQAPLRSVSSFLELLARRYKGKLGPEADEYISFAVDGATRMHHLINDILLYSRLSSRAQAPEPTDCRAVVDQALRDLRENIRESGAEITTDDLPTVSAVKSQMVQLVSNLLDNAIKYRKDEPPRIHIAAERLEREWLFSIRDNGIGFEQQYADRIFRVFQRLHTEGRYPGTGIGLAMCKKIVERHGGRIWVKSAPGQGTVFFFTIPSAEETP
jgi:signal transduction histidine kinase